MCKACPVVERGAVSGLPETMTNRTRPGGSSEYVLWFEDYRDEQRPRVGGKNSSLGTMMKAGLPVPPGFAVTTDAYETLKRDPETRAEVIGLLREVDLTDSPGLREISGQVRKVIEQIPVDPAIEISVRHAYEQLEERCGLSDVPVAVRSSATSEDLPDASFAGQQDTFLWVTGADAVVEAMRRCWSSIYSDRAISYRHETGHDHDVISMSVGIQKMVDPKVAGVAFTLNPENGDRSQVAIDASWGLGEAVVSGEVTPDNFLVDKVVGEIVRRIISPKQIEYRVENGGVSKCDVDDGRQSIPCVDDAELRAIAAMARRAEKHYGCPQDIEWAIDKHLPEGENVILLQARPETVWSRKKAVPIADGHDPIHSIVTTLMTPMHSRHT
jgi:pyruvate, water dikinase